jgi:hypothetical protein
MAALFLFLLAATSAKLPQKPAVLTSAAAAKLATGDPATGQTQYYVLEHGVYNKDGWITQWNALAVVVGFDLLVHRSSSIP